jgi:hypothetical protein
VTESKGYEDLANAIIEQAASDYKFAYTKYLKKPNDIYVKARLDELRVFFHGQWYGALTTLDANYLLEQIETECKKKHALKESLMGRSKELEWK